MFLELHQLTFIHLVWPLFYTELIANFNWLILINVIPEILYWEQCYFSSSFAETMDDVV